MGPFCRSGCFGGCQHPEQASRARGSGMGCGDGQRGKEEPGISQDTAASPPRPSPAKGVDPSSKICLVKAMVFPVVMYGVRFGL